MREQQLKNNSKSKQRSIITQLVADFQNITFITWNARALLCVDHDKRDRKIAYLNKHMHDTHIVALQEVHRNEHAFKVLAFALLKTHVLFHSSCANESAGGCAFLVRKDLFKRYKVVCEEVVLGRVQRLHMENVFRLRC